jgi:dephospho-CoA kinase
MFVQCGAHLIDADVLARDAVVPGSPGLRAIAAAFGPGMLCADGTLNRQRLAQVVFNDPTQRARLEAIVHPYVFAEEERRCKEIVAKDPHTVVVFDAALLIETGAYKSKDRVIVVTADEPTQLARVMSRNNLTEAQARERIGAQMPLSEKIKDAHYVIDGTLPIEKLRQEVSRIYEELRKLTSPD